MAFPASDNEGVMVGVLEISDDGVVVVQEDGELGRLVEEDSGDDDMGGIWCDEGDNEKPVVAYGDLGPTKQEVCGVA